MLAPTENYMKIFEVSLTKLACVNFYLLTALALSLTALVLNSRHKPEFVERLHCLRRHSWHHIRLTNSQEMTV